MLLKSLKSFVHLEVQLPKANARIKGQSQCQCNQNDGSQSHIIWAIFSIFKVQSQAHFIVLSSFFAVRSNSKESIAGTKMEQSCEMSDIWEIFHPWFSEVCDIPKLPKRIKLTCQTRQISHILPTQKKLTDFVAKQIFFTIHIIWENYFGFSYEQKLCLQQTATSIAIQMHT